MFQEYVSQLLGEGLTTDKPPWEMHVLQDTGKKAVTVAVLRVHQSVADGTALVKMLCRCLGDTEVSPHVRVSTLPDINTLDNHCRGCFCLNNPMSQEQ